MLPLNIEGRSMEKDELLKGTLDMLILRSLESGPQHGFGIAEMILRRSEEALKVGEGSLYPALYRLERRRWIAAEWGQSENNRRAKYYRLTEKGRKQLEAQASHWKAMCAAIALVMKTT